MDVDMGDGLSDEEHQSMEEDTFQAGEEVPSDEELSTQAPTLDVQHADNLVWLAKVPMFLIERWQNARANATLGHMHEHKTGTGEIKAISMHLTAEDAEKYKLPKDYDLQFAPVALSTHIFTEDKQSRARTFEGYVESEATVKVANMMDPHYRAIMKERTRQQKEGRSKIKMMNESESTRSQRVIPQKTGGVSLSLQNRRVKNSINERIPKEELIEFLFGLFEQYAKWNMKGLKEKTKQPTSWLKEILGEIAFYHRKGEYRGCYELLPEYKQSHQAAADIDPNQSTANAMSEGDEKEESDGDDVFEDA